MKKSLLALLAVAFLAGSAVAGGDGSNGEINAKLGIEIGSYSGDMSDFEQKPGTGFNITAEYLYPVADIVKVGAGVGYLFDRAVNTDTEPGDDEQKFSIIPIYLTAQVNPISSAKEVFFKANLGYSILKVDSDFGDAKNGFMYGLEAGYEFPFGLLVSVDYTMYACGIEGKDSDGTAWDYNFNYGKFGINVGYKFKI
jgi:hypothetical protein